MGTTLKELSEMVITTGESGILQLRNPANRDWMDTVLTPGKVLPLGDGEEYRLKPESQAVRVKRIADQLRGILKDLESHEVQD